MASDTVSDLTRAPTGALSIFRKGKAMIRKIQASQLQPGMTVAFSNSRHNFLIDDVRTVRDGEIRVDHGDYTAVDFYRADEIVWILGE